MRRALLVSLLAWSVASCSDEPRELVYHAEVNGGAVPIGAVLVELTSGQVDVFEAPPGVTLYSAGAPSDPDVWRVVLIVDEGVVPSFDIRMLSTGAPEPVAAVLAAATTANAELDPPLGVTVQISLPVTARTSG